MEYLSLILLGLVQGVAEFLPISSSGHLVVLGTLLEHFTGEQLQASIVTNIVLHFGTLLAVLVFYWKRIWRLLGQDRRGIGLLIVGTLPVVFIGGAVELFFEEYLTSPILAGLMLPVTGLVLIGASRLTPGQLDYTEIRYSQALLIGCAQAVAILPGISRSGMTISAGLLMGLRAEAAATYSFLLAIPAIGGATVLGIWKLFKESSQQNSMGALTVGAIVAFAVGLLSLWILMRVLEKGRLQLFAYWCIPVGIGVLVWQLWP